MTSHTLSELAARVGGEVAGDGTVRLEGVAPLEEADATQLSFFSNKKYRQAFEASRAGAVVVEPETSVPPGRAVLRVRNAYLAFAKISTLFHPPREPLPEVAPSAVIHPTARVHPSAQVMPLACVGPAAEVGARAMAWFDNNIVDGLVNLVGRLGVWASFLVGKFDNAVVDGAVNGVATATIESGSFVRRIQTGKLYHYVFVLAGGVLIIFLVKAF